MTLYRSFAPDLEVRSDGEGRTIVGIAVPWGRTIDVPSEGIRERFANGAFNHQLRAANRVDFARDHIPLGGVLIGATKLMRNDAKGLYVELLASRTAAGNDTIELVKDGALRELSVGFKERTNRRVPDAGGPITERVKADLGEIAIVRQGAYGKDAVATGVRSLDPLTDEEEQIEEALRSLDVTREILSNWRPLPLP